MISARDVWRIFLIFFTFVVLMLAAGVLIQRDILPSSVERDIHEHPAFVKHDASGEYMWKALPSSSREPVHHGNRYTRTRD